MTGAPAAGRRVLVAFFSRAGENYFYGGRRNLAVGNTEVVAGMIRDRTGADLYKIEPADRYPDSYDETVNRNNEEQQSSALPAIAGARPDVGPYEVVMLGSPVWGSRAPRIMSTVLGGVDLRQDGAATGHLCGQRHVRDRRLLPQCPDHRHG